LYNMAVELLKCTSKHFEENKVNQGTEIEGSK
jgi:hypothetical protein